MFCFIAKFCSKIVAEKTQEFGGNALTFAAVKARRARFEAIGKYYMGFGKKMEG